MMVWLAWREETLHLRFGPGAQERPEPVVQRGVGHGAPALLAQVLGPAGDDEDLDELPGGLGMLEYGPADRAGSSPAPAEGLHGLLEVVLGAGLDLVGDGDEYRAADGYRQGHVRRSEQGGRQIVGGDRGEPPAHPRQQCERDGEAAPAEGPGDAQLAGHGAPGCAAGGGGAGGHGEVQGQPAGTDPVGQDLLGGEVEDRQSGQPPGAGHEGDQRRGSR